MSSRAEGSKDKLRRHDHIQKSNYFHAKASVFFFFLNCFSVLFCLAGGWRGGINMALFREVEAFKCADVCDCTLAACWEPLLLLRAKLFNHL